MEQQIFREEMVVNALKLWCSNVELICKIHAEGGDITYAANKVLSDNYDYDQGKVLFKPTLAFGPQTFRSTKEGALAYFIGGNSDFLDDKGLKLKPWVKVWFNKLDYVLQNDVAIVQCSVHFLGSDDCHLFVNKSFVLKICDDDDRVRVVPHQSSLLSGRVLPHDAKEPQYHLSN